MLKYSSIRGGSAAHNLSQKTNKNHVREKSTEQKRKSVMLEYNAIQIYAK